MLYEIQSIIIHDRTKVPVHHFRGNNKQLLTLTVLTDVLFLIPRWFISILPRHLAHLKRYLALETAVIEEWIEYIRQIFD